MGTNSGPTAQGGSGACSAPGGLTVGLRVGLPSRAGLTRTAWRDRDKGASCTRELALLCRDFLESLVLCGGGCPVPPSRPRLPCPSQLPGGLSQGQHPPAPDMTGEAGMESSPPPPNAPALPHRYGRCRGRAAGPQAAPGPTLYEFPQFRRVRSGSAARTGPWGATSITPQGTSGIKHNTSGTPGLAPGTHRPLPGWAGGCLT